MKALVVIPARYGSTRLPGKPLRLIAGTSLLHRTVGFARRALQDVYQAKLVVATDDQRIVDHAAAIGCDAVLTDTAIGSGSGRALAAAHGDDAPIIVNLQGDAPFQPIDGPAAAIHAVRAGADVATPVVQLDWAAFDAMRLHKQRAPFSGTTCARAADGRALWFSKLVLPAMRDEAACRQQPLSPVWRHIGLYAYRRAALEAFEVAPPTTLEQLEGLEQLRLLELGLRVQAVAVPPAPFDSSGIDSEDDIVRAEALIGALGDPAA